jgi:predicted flap endonuclease-1-like 5' DNA nuclease
MTMSVSLTFWPLIMPLLSEPTGEASRIPPWLWFILALLIIGLPILTVAFGPKLRGKATEAPPAALEHAARATEQAHAIQEAVVPPAPDDLTRIEGIGPKISRTLQDAGITTFHALAAAGADRLAAILEPHPNLRLANPASWPQQATLAAAGDWDELEKLQAALKAGRTNV